LIVVLHKKTQKSQVILEILPVQKKKKKKNPKKKNKQKEQGERGGGGGGGGGGGSQQMAAHKNELKCATFANYVKESIFKDIIHSRRTTILNKNTCKYSNETIKPIQREEVIFIRQFK